jgi:DNA mismatch repair protein MutL
VRKVKILSESVVRKIAAGEVIERPAAVVKELVENALDAGSTRIGVDLEQGGTTCTAVEDDGAGMSADDAAMALKRHATSKIDTVEDLDRISTL